MQKTLRFVAIVMLCWLTAGAATPLVSVAIRSSSIDSTPIGATVPSSVRGTYFVAKVLPPSSAEGNAAYVGWNATGTGGEMDILTSSGSGGYGGVRFYNTAGGAWNVNTPLATIDKGGNITAQTSMFAPAVTGSSSVTGGYVSGGFLNASSNSTNAAFGQGGYTMWNLGAGTGETDFVNLRGTGIGGFRWYNATSLASLGGPFMYTNSDGTITNNNGFNGPLNGNATSAATLDHSPANCTSGSGASGISSTGAAQNCKRIPETRSLTTNSCTTGGSSYNVCTLTGNWSSGSFTTGTPRATCSLISASDSRAYLGAITTVNANGVNVTLVTGGSVAVTGSATCIGVVD